MKKSILLFFTALSLLFSISITTAYAQTTHYEADKTHWVWVSADSKYGKLYAPDRVTVTSRKNGVPVRIEAWIKTTYSATGAAETVPAMKLSKEIPVASTLRYSLALVEINPQSRTLDYLEEIFYDANGKVLVSHKYDKPRIKEITSQAFDENFYDAIIDHVFDQGETKRAKASDRWITLWRHVGPSLTTSASADTTTIRKRGNDVFVWTWEETRKNTGGVIADIKFCKKVFNLKNYTYKTISYSHWTTKNRWQNENSSLNGNYIAIVPDSREDSEFRAIENYVKANPDWAARYQI